LAADDRLMLTLLVLAMIGILALLQGCATSRAVQELPASWWTGTAGVIEATLRDLVSVLRFFFG